MSVRGRRARFPGIGGCWAAAAVALLAVLIPAGRVTAQPGPSAGSVGIRLLDAPTNRADDPRAKVYIVDHVSPGTTIQRHVQVSNSTGSAVAISLYGGAASIGASGWVADGRRGGNDLAGWIAVSPDAVTVAAGGSATALVTIAVPKDAPAGERYAVVWAALPPSTGSGQVTVANLVGIRTYLSVGAGGEPPSDFVIDSVAAARTPAGPQLIVAVRNTGGRALDMTGAASLTDGPGKLSAGPFDIPALTVAIGGSASILVPLPPTLPAGLWDVGVTLTSGLITHSAIGRIDLPAGLQASPTPVALHPAPVPSRGAHRGIIAAALGLLVLLGLLIFLLARRRREDEEVPQPGRERVPAGASHHGSHAGPRHRY